MTSEAKIRNLCTRLLATQSDEAANAILVELRDALHEHCESLRLRMAQEYPFHKEEMAAG